MTDQRTAQFHEGLMNITTSVGAHTQSAKLVQPTERAFNRPTRLTQAAAVFVAGTCGQQRDATASEFEPMSLRAIRTVALHPQRSADRSADLACHRRNGIDQRQKLRHVVSIGAGERDGQGNALSVGDEVVFGAWFSAIGGVGTGLVAPPTARTDEESTKARDQS